MKTVIRIVKRGSEENKDASEAVVRAKPRTAEMIVKSWIIESRENRRTAMSQLQGSIGLNDLGRLARG